MVELCRRNARIGLILGLGLQPKLGLGIEYRFGVRIGVRIGVRVAKKGVRVGVEVAVEFRVRAWI